MPASKGTITMVMGTCPKCASEFAIPVSVVINGEFDKCPQCGHQFVPASNQGEESMPPNPTKDEFASMFPPGTRIEYQGDEWLVIEAPSGDEFRAMKVPGQTENFTKEEFEEEQFTLDDEPSFKIPVRTQYPPQVFVLTDARGDDTPQVHVFADLGALKEHDGIDGDQIMEAISDPGTVIQIEDDLVLVFAGIEGAK